MRASGLGFALVVGAVAACGNRPLDGGPPGMGGTSGFDASIVLPDGSAEPIFPPDASTGPVYSAACWASSLPAPVQPLPPHTTVTDACALGAAATSTDWLYPYDQAGTKGDDRRYIVGRWAVCSQSIFGLARHDGIEFGANGRWRMLTLDATTGELVPMDRSATTSGTYYLLGIGQLYLAAELGGAASNYPVTFTGALDAINFNNPAGRAEVYARTTPSPLNGADNPPPTAAGPCSMVGDWELPATGVIDASPTVFSFDAAGNAVLGSATANLCVSNYPFGTYALAPGLFAITSSAAGCAWWYSASYQAAFDASCNQILLVPRTDNCTGGRTYFNGPTTLTRRPAGPTP